ncbi:MAG: tRNA (adenosine(37)-N6)-threonylcarbamoyltransferase complex dimerization subunit type 1 TsaB [Microcoleus sp. SIO2G3]|nr:tRNA (adenosine(37)-N6)-threonylcarbamoyltransferase complex dimerization subunit type 1 TsaB [Microcoleus sp. SIO2G3]
MSIASYGLALHTSSPELGLALSNFAEDQRCQTWNLGLALSIDLHVQLQQFLAPQSWQDLAFLVVSRGPGSFTGTRIGMVTARTIAQQLDIPLFAISSLAAIAKRSRNIMAYSHRAIEQDIAVQMPASRGELFVAIYSTQLTALLPDTVMSAVEWEQCRQNWPRPLNLITAPEKLGDTVTDLLAIAHTQWQAGERPDWSIALPFYGQHPVT